ncbi:glycoside hydrolase family 125 protein [Novosphingobium acidiphilum]|uniref:glycoside hydrolase family 125 protein n=1 Tax=Novosphingobium acidiphilum TaxID=505248 RepID=UPI0012ECB22F|nr:glycoside hydrolase family 125 protein [Novosphingobium acidiphilum]
MALMDVLARTALAISALPLCAAAPAPEAPRDVALTLKPDDVIPTGNDWIALPTIRAGDGAIRDFNVISMRYRGLVEMAGLAGRALITPFVEIDGHDRPLEQIAWTLRDYWIPTATMTADGLRISVTYVAPPESRAAIIRFRITNLTDHRVHVAPGVRLGWGATHRVTYSPEPLGGARTMTPTPIDTDMQVFSYGTDDAHVAWGFGYVGSQAVLQPGADPGLIARHPDDLAPGQTLDMHYLIGAGMEEYSAAYAMRVLNARIDRYGIDGVIDQAALALHRLTRTTGQADLDRIMNRNLLFTHFFAWGRAIDTEQFVGVTSRSNRYYVSAAFWDRDALLWSFPALLDSDRARARQAIDYAFTIQGRNIGIHSRFIDGVVLEDGLELDELVAPVHALARYVRVTHDATALSEHRARVAALLEQLAALRDPATGLYATFQDAQDEYIRKPFSIYDNVLVWRALLDWADTGATPAGAAALRTEAAHLRAAILHHGVHDAPGATGPILAASVDAHDADCNDVPPGSLMKLPALGFIGADDPLFVRTYAWLHSARYRYGYADQPFGLPGSYRLPFTTSWAVADHLRLQAGRERALKILRQSPWDGGIVTEGVKPQTGLPDSQGLAFATAAGYVAHAICDTFCIDRPQ